MKDMIKEIVDIDREAQQITDAAQQKKLSSAEEVAKRREEIRAQYLDRARKRIAKMSRRSVLLPKKNGKRQKHTTPQSVKSWKRTIRKTATSG